MNVLRETALVLAISAAATLPAHSAALVFDDTDPNFITISANDFEGGLFINGTLLQIGLGAPASITLPDGGYGLSGSWLDLGATVAGDTDVFFALAGNPTDVTSGVEWAASTDGSMGTITGSFGGFTGSVYFTGSPTFLQDGHTEGFSLPFLGGVFISEPIPEPGTYAMMLAGLAGLGWFARRKAS